MKKIDIIQKGNKTIISGISGSGKTTKLLEIIKEKIDKGEDIIIFSLNLDIHNKLIDKLKILEYKNTSLGSDIFKYSVYRRNCENKEVFFSFIPMERSIGEINRTIQYYCLENVFVDYNKDIGGDIEGNNIFITFLEN